MSKQILCGDASDMIRAGEAVWIASSLTYAAGILVMHWRDCAGRKLALRPGIFRSSQNG